MKENGTSSPTSPKKMLNGASGEPATRVSESDDNGPSQRRRSSQSGQRRNSYYRRRPRQSSTDERTNNNENQGGGAQHNSDSEAAVARRDNGGRRIQNRDGQLRRFRRFRRRSNPRLNSENEVGDSGGRGEGSEKPGPRRRPSRPSADSRSGNGGRENVNADGDHAEQSDRRPGTRYPRRERPLSVSSLSNRAENEVYVSRRTNFRTQIMRCRKMLERGEDEIIVHGLGSAINRAINLALQLKQNGIDIAVTTSTVELYDEVEQENDSGEPEQMVRQASAVHIRLFRPREIKATA